ncbi:unnamed protein product [Ostreobium quekettii]|uniref:HIRAN domain-containing protein n=1 Tax=Ostreobium quekettii TaxID=121088 RepID=A0A8S1IJW8_9CHLO|nr:unnamed protein product [Ostreobium quekettii]
MTRFHRLQRCTSLQDSLCAAWRQHWRTHPVDGLRVPDSATLGAVAPQSMRPSRVHENVAAAHARRHTPQEIKPARQVVLEDPLLQKIIESRQRITRSPGNPMERIKVAGVSFEDRQEVLASCNFGDVVILSHEPWNPVDPSAVAVHLLDGRQLGYVPRDSTGVFTHKTTFGRISSVGRNEVNLYGAFIDVQPSLPYFTFCPVALHLGANEHILDCLGQDHSDRLRQAALEKAGKRCAITGISHEDCKLEVCDEWWCDDDKRVGYMDGLDVLAAPLAWLRRLPGIHAAGTQEWNKGMVVMANINGWSVSEAEQYTSQRRQNQLQMSLSAKGTQAEVASQWKLDFSWLREQGVEIPELLRQTVMVKIVH